MSDSGLDCLISFCFVHFIAEPLENEYTDVYQAGRRRMESTKILLILDVGGRLAGMFSKEFFFFDVSF